MVLRHSLKNRMRRKKNLNKILAISTSIFLFSLVTLLFGGNIVKAQSPLSIDVTKGIQSGKTGEIPLKIKIRSSIASDKFELNINAPSELQAVYTPHIFTKIEADKDYEIEYLFKPTKAGVYTIVVEGQIWEADTNYKTSDIATFTINDKLQQEPVSEQYLSEVRQKKILNLIKTFLIIVIIIALGTFFTKKFIEWLNKEN